MKNPEYVKRLHEAFEGEKMADVARILGVPHATVRNYYNGRLPASEVLVKIALKTDISLNWLLTGVGERYSGEVRHVSLGAFIEQKIGELIGEKLQEMHQEANKPASESEETTAESAQESTQETAAEIAPEADSEAAPGTAPEAAETDT